jgi:hypothetical protein
MRCTLFVILLPALLTPDSSLCQERTFYLSPLLSYDSFRTPGFDYGVDFGAGAGVRISPSLVISASVSFGHRTLTFDVIGGSQSFNARLVAIGGSLEVLLLGRPGGAGLAATFGAGRISSIFDAQTVSLGALGSVTLPGHSSARGFMQTGIAGEIPLSADVVFVVLPSVRFFTPLSSTADFSFAGGLRVGIF